jgi:UDP-N-acetylmuramoylalanine-D-glutamate ligase
MAYSLEKFRPDYSIFTNFKPDHLNWHKDLQDYLDAKMNLMEHTRKKCIINKQVIDFTQEHALHIRIPKVTRIFGLLELDESYRRI